MNEQRNFPDDCTPEEVAAIRAPRESCEAVAEFAQAVFAIWIADGGGE